MWLKSIVFVVIFVELVSAALPPSVQREIDLSNMKSYLEMQDESSIVLKAKVRSSKEIVPEIDPKSRMAYTKKIILEIQTSKIIRNKNNIKIPPSILLRYGVYVPNMMPGPKVDNVLVPNQDKIYTFYLSDDLSLNASNYSIDTEDNSLRKYALDEVNFHIEELVSIDFEELKPYNMAPINKIFRFQKVLDQKTKEKIKDFLLKTEYKKYRFINIKAYSSQNIEHIERFKNTYLQVKQVTRFLEKTLKIDPNKIKFSMDTEAKKLCTQKNKSKFEKPCIEINLWVDIVLD